MLLDDGEVERLTQLISRVGAHRANAHADVRRFYQRLGVEGVRDHLGQDAWLARVDQTIRSVDGPVVVTDVRFPNEAELVRAHGGLVVRTERPGTTPAGGHISDTGVAALAVDETLANDDDLRALSDQVTARVGAWSGSATPRGA